MKTKSLLLGLVFFFFGMIVTLGVVASIRHNHFSHHAEIRKTTIIEVGAPLTVTELKNMGLI